MSKLTNVKGRINYISSHARQENLYSVYDTIERKFWSELAKCNQEEFEKNGTGGKCIEARELIIALPESFVDYEPDMMLKLFVEHFKRSYEVECIGALHHNKRKTNYHIHLIFSERRLLEEPIEKVASRNMFYNENREHVRTKKEIIDDEGHVRKGCRIIPKGIVYEQKIFTTKDSKFKNEAFLNEVKCAYTELINMYVKDKKEKLQVFDRSSPYLAMKKIGKNNPKAGQIESDNGVRQRWNQTVDRALIGGITEEKIMDIRQTEIVNKARVYNWDLMKLWHILDGTNIAVYSTLDSIGLLCWGRIGRNHKELLECVKTRDIDIITNNLKLHYISVSEFVKKFIEGEDDHV